MRPIQITIQGIGAHRSSLPTPIRFTSEPVVHPSYLLGPGKNNLLGEWRPPDEYERACGLSQLFLLHSEEDATTTTALESVHGLFDLLSRYPTCFFTEVPGALLSENARAQLDLLVTHSGRKAILSIWFGSDEPPVDWDDLIACRTAWGARQWIRVGFVGDGRTIASGTNSLGAAFLRAVQAAEGTVTEPKDWYGFFDGTEPGHAAPLPSVLHFGRRAAEWQPGYRPATRLGVDPFAIMDVASRGISEPAVFARLESIRQHHTSVLSRDDRRSRHSEPPRWTQSRPEHASMSRLDEYQQSLLAIGLALSLHATRSAIVLVDGIDRTLGSRDPTWVWNALHRLLVTRPDTMVIATTPDFDTARSFIDHRFEGILIGGREPIRIALQ